MRAILRPSLILQDWKCDGPNPVRWWTKIAFETWPKKRYHAAIATCIIYYISLFTLVVNSPWKTRQHAGLKWITMILSYMLIFRHGALKPSKTKYHLYESTVKTKTRDSLTPVIRRVYKSKSVIAKGQRLMHGKCQWRCRWIHVNHLMLWKVGASVREYTEASLSWLRIPRIQIGF